MIRVWKHDSPRPHKNNKTAMEPIEEADITLMEESTNTLAHLLPVAENGDPVDISAMSCDDAPEDEGRALVCSHENFHRKPTATTLPPSHFTPSDTKQRRPQTISPFTSAMMVSPMTDTDSPPSLPSPLPIHMDSPPSLMKSQHHNLRHCDMSTIAPAVDCGENSPSSTQVDIIEYHKRHLQRHSIDQGHDSDVSPDAFLERLQGDSVFLNISSNSNGGLDLQNEGLISKRLQEIESKKIILHQKRISLEQRLYDFVDSEKRLRVMVPSPHSSISTTHSSLMLHSSQTNSVTSPKSLLLSPPTPSHDNPLMQLQPIHQNGDQMVQNFPWNDPRTGTVAHRFSGILNSRKQPQGWGIMHFLDGQVYEGQTYAGYRWGMGTNVWPDGQKYVGEWEDNSRNGRGTHTWKDGRRATGHWSGGHLNGKVLFSWPDGASYEGQCRMGKKHGRGTHTWKNGKLYSGNYVSGKEEGFGSLTHSDWRYRGQFKCGKREGYGMQIWRNKTYDGEWYKNKAHGKGRIVWQSGATYTGEFKNGKYHGLGVYLWPSGKKFVGSWKDGCKHGQGVYTFPSGKKYDGSYANGLKDGYGRLTWPDGRMYSGSFRKGKREGRGIQTNPDGSMVHCGFWKDDKPFVKGEVLPSDALDTSDNSGSSQSISTRRRYQETGLNTSEEDIVFMESHAVAVADDSHTASRSSYQKVSEASENSRRQLTEFRAFCEQNSKPAVTSTIKAIPATPSKILDDVSSIGESVDHEAAEPTSLLGSFEQVSL